MGFLATPMAWILNVIYDLIGNYGLSILALTLLVKLLMYPLYIKQMKSTSSMSSLQPKMKELQKKYSQDRALYNQKVSELYKEEGINPMGGCLPMLIQMPIIFGLFALLRSPTLYLEQDMIYAVNEEFLWVQNLSQPDLYILPILAAATTFIAFLFNASDLQVGDSGASGAGMQKVMKYIFPAMILLLARSSSAGLALYWFASQFIQIFLNMANRRYKKALLNKNGKK